MDRSVLVCRKFVELAKTYGADEIIAVATSAAREAKNQGVLIDRLHSEAGLDVGIISGLEEARLIFLGVSSGIQALGPQCIVHGYWRREHGDIDRQSEQLHISGQLEAGGYQTYYDVR